MLNVIPNLHPIFVHFTVALLTVASLLFLLSAFCKKSECQAKCLTVAKWNFFIGAFISIGTLLSGLQAYNVVNHDTLSHAAMTSHRNWAFVTAAVFFILAFCLIKYRSKDRVRIPFVVCMLVGTILLLTTAYKGGELVYRYGLGVASLPKSHSSGGNLNKREQPSPEKNAHGIHEHDH